MTSSPPEGSSDGVDRQRTASGEGDNIHGHQSHALLDNTNSASGTYTAIPMPGEVEKEFMKYSCFALRQRTLALGPVDLCPTPTFRPYPNFLTHEPSRGPHHLKRKSGLRFVNVFSCLPS